jgi:hypothetical protein
MRKCARVLPRESSDAKLENVRLCQDFAEKYGGRTFATISTVETSGGSKNTSLTCTSLLEAYGGSNP